MRRYLFCLLLLAGCAAPTLRVQTSALPPEGRVPIEPEAILPPPMPLQTVQLSWSTPAVALYWTGDTNATGYNIYSGIQSGVYETKLELGAQTNWTGPLTAGTNFYAVTATEGTNESGFSNEVEASPARPRAVTVLESTNLMDWTAVTNLTGTNVELTLPWPGCYLRVESAPPPVVLQLSL